MVAARLANLTKADAAVLSSDATADLQSHTRKEAAEKLNVSVRPVKPDRESGGKRSAEFQRKYAKAVKAIEAGNLAPEVKPVAVHVSCGTSTETSILAQAVKVDRRFSRDTQGQVMFQTAA